MQKLLLKGKIEGNRGRRGRPRATKMKNVKEWVGHMMDV